MTDPSSTPPDVRRVITAIDTLSGELKDTRDQLAKADARAKWARAIAIIGIAATGVAGVAAFEAKSNADDNARNTAQIEAARAEARVSSCVQQNVTTEKTRAAFVQSITLLATNSKDQTEDAAKQKRIDALLVAYTDSVKDALPFRDCTERGIDRYFETPPADPAMGGND